MHTTDPRTPRTTLFPYTTLFRSWAKMAQAREMTMSVRETSERRKNTSGVNEETSGSVFPPLDRKSTRLNSSHVERSYAVFCLKKKSQQPDLRGGCRQQRAAQLAR